MGIRTITVLMVEPHRHPYLKTVEHELKNLQSLVGGNITATYPWEDPIALIADDDGLYKQEYEFNRYIDDYHFIRGNCFLCGLCSDDFDDIPMEADMSVFASYCQAYARWKAAEEFITSHGYVSMTPAGYVQQLPHVSISQTYQKIMNRCAEQLGLTPSSRSRLIAGEPGGTVKDDMEELLGGG